MAVEELKTFLEHVLRKYENDQGLIVTRVQEEKSNRQGDGFMSEVTMAEVVGKTGSGAPYSNNVFIKKQVSNKVRAELFSMDLAFNNEATVYSDILPLIPGGTDDLPKCVYGGKDCIVLEDLRAQGYKMASDKMNGLELAQSQLVMKAIAKFHASTYALQTLHPDIFTKLTANLSNIFKVDTFISSFETSLINCIYNLQHIDDKSLESSVAKLEKLKGRMSSTLDEYRQSELVVLGHGDLWFNNLMFRHKDGVVQDTKLIDLQAAWPMSPAVDIWTCLYTCVSPDLLNSCGDQLISIYCTTFRETLRKMNLAPGKIPDEETLRKEIYSRELYGFLTMTFYGLPLYMDFTDGTFNVDEEMSDPECINKFQNVFYKGYAERLAAMVRRCQLRNIL